MYEPFYSLSGKPFQLSPDPTFYYGSPVHRRAYAYLEYGLYQGEGFIVITGEVGAGKTTLVRNLLAHLDSRQVVAAHLVSTQLDADDLLRAVAGAFGLPVKNTDKASLLSELESFLRRVSGERKRALLIVDEAQNLTPRAVEELRMLSNFQSGERALLQSFLIGQPELRNILQGQDMQQFRQRIIASYHLGPLDRAETEAYIVHRLNQVGWSGDPKLEPGAFESVYAFTAGIPRRINMLCNRLLLAGFLNEKHVLDTPDVELVAGEIKEELGLAPRNAAATEDGGRDAQPAWNFREAGMYRQRRLTQEAATEGADEALVPRVVRLERTLSMVLGTLRRVVNAMEPLEKPVKELRP
jgi:putative secretion ATPase (PEP-CTERM system associated)